MWAKTFSPLQGTSKTLSVRRICGFPQESFGRFNLMRLLHWRAVTSSGSSLERPLGENASSPVRTRALVLLFVAFPAFLLYLSMLSPTITRGGDCGELTTASYLMGIGHPTGYPVWCQLTRLFAFLPLGEVAWRYALFDAICGALAAGVLAVVSHRILAPVPGEQSERERFHALWGALGGGWMLAGFWLVASQSIISEVYALAGLEGAAILYFLVAWRQNGDWRDAFSLVFVCGSVFVVHLSGIFFLPFVFVAAIWKRRFTRARVFACAAFFGLALLPWLYLPIRSASFPTPPSTELNSYFVWPLDWNHPATPQNFKNHVTAAQYRSLLWKTSVVNGRERMGLAQPLWKLPRRAGELATALSLRWLWATPLVLVGAFASFRRENRLIALALFGSLALNIGVELNYNVSDQINFFFPAYLVMSVWLALGWASLGRALGRYPLLLPFLIFITVGVQWFLFASTTSYAGRTRIGDLARLQASTLQALSKPERPTQFIARQDDTLWPFWYAQHVLGLAPDVVTPWGRALKFDPSSEQIARYVAELKPGFPVVLAQWDDATDARFPLVMLDRAGTLCKASNRALPPPATSIAPPARPTARFAREPLWKNADKPQVPAILSACLAAFEVDFQTPREVGARDEVVGYLEVLLASPARFEKTGPSPGQNEEGEGEDDNRQLSVAFERRRLVAPARARSGAWLRARVPLWIEPTLAGSETNVWTRVVSRSGELKAWKKSDAILITGR